MFGLFEKSRKYQDISGADFENKFAKEKNTVVLDVRSQGEFTSGHLPGAININLLGLEFTSKVTKLDRDKVYVVYCRTGNRSADACSILADRGFRVFNLVGGIMNWKGKIV